MKAKKIINKLESYLNRLIFPWECIVCGGIVDQKNTSICIACNDILPRSSNVCMVCGLPIENLKTGYLICGQCQKRPPYFDYLKAAFWYQAPVNKLITDYKYFQHWQNSLTLINLFTESLNKIPPNCLIVPMPSHPSRIRERGFNVVYELIRLLSKRIEIQYDLACVRRIKKTETQTGKTKSQRKNNLKNAFSIRKPVCSEHVIIFDEVVTTGASVNELSKCLKRAGVKKVGVWAIARTR